MNTFRMTTFGTLLALGLLSSTASAQVWNEDFEGGSNEGAWELYWNNFNNIESSGGNPGSYLRLNNLAGSATCQFIDIAPTVWPAGFSGDWRAAAVTSVGLDVDVTVGPFTNIGAWTLTIGNDNGTPGNLADDCKIEFVSPQMPSNMPGWTSFDFSVPSQSPTLPQGWAVYGTCAAGTDGIWNYVMQDVDYFSFRMDTDPTTFCAFWNWDMGVDNLRVETSLTATAYCFGDGTGVICPCGNIGAAGEGCANSGGSGASLAASGSGSVAVDDLTLVMTKGPGPVSAIVFAGVQPVNSGMGAIFGDGLLCAGGAIQRLGVVTLDAAGNGTWGPGLAPQGGWSAGDTRNFQGWYRDPSGPCGGQFNTSHALSITFSS